jgi:hypothetical protein
MILASDSVVKKHNLNNSSLIFFIFTCIRKTANRDYYLRQVSLCLSVCVCLSAVSPPVCLSVFLSGSVSLCLCFSVSASLSASVSLCLRMSVSLCLCFSICVFLPVCLSVSDCLSACLSLCLWLLLCLSPCLCYSLCVFLSLCLCFFVCVFQSVCVSLSICVSVFMEKLESNWTNFYKISYLRIFTYYSEKIKIWL